MKKQLPFSLKMGSCEKNEELDVEDWRNRRKTVLSISKKWVLARKTPSVCIEVVFLLSLNISFMFEAVFICCSSFPMGKKCFETLYHYQNLKRWNGKNYMKYASFDNGWFVEASLNARKHYFL